MPELATEYVSPAFETLGFPIEDFYTNPNLVYELMHPDDLLMMREANKAVYAQEEIETSYEYRIYTKDGELRWWRDHGQPLLGEDGEQIKWVGVISDITDRGKPMPNLILLNLNMPRKNGMEALEEIKADQNLRRIPIVILTTSKAEEDIIRTYDLGVNSFVVKPVTFESLVDLVKELGKYWFQIVELPEGETV